MSDGIIYKRGSVYSVDAGGYRRPFFSEQEAIAAVKAQGKTPVIVDELADQKPNEASAPTVTPEEVEARIEQMRGKAPAQPIQKQPAQSAPKRPASTSRESIERFLSKLREAYRYASKKNQRVLKIKIETIEELLYELEEN